MISPQEAYNVLFKNGHIGKLKSAIDIGNKYIFVFNSITGRNDAPCTGPFRISVDKYNGEISMYNILSKKATTSIDVTSDIVTFYDKKLRR